MACHSAGLVLHFPGEAGRFAVQNIAWFSIEPRVLYLVRPPVVPWPLSPCQHFILLSPLSVWLDVTPGLTSVRQRPRFRSKSPRFTDLSSAATPRRPSCLGDCGGVPCVGIAIQSQVSEMKCKASIKITSQKRKKSKGFVAG